MIALHVLTIVQVGSRHTHLGQWRNWAAYGGLSLEVKQGVSGGKWSNNIRKTLMGTGKSPSLMGTSTISLAMFNSHVTNHQRVLLITILLSDNIDGNELNTLVNVICCMK